MYVSVLSLVLFGDSVCMCLVLGSSVCMMIWLFCLCGLRYVNGLGWWLVSSVLMLVCVNSVLVMGFFCCWVVCCC